MILTLQSQKEKKCQILYLLLIKLDSTPSLLSPRLVGNSLSVKHWGSLNSSSVLKLSKNIQEGTSGPWSATATAEMYTL